jgi:hypothetical protein
MKTSVMLEGYSFRVHLRSIKRDDKSDSMLKEIGSTLALRGKYDQIIDRSDHS